MLYHSFALDAKDSYSGTMAFFEELIEEHRTQPTKSRLLHLVPTVGDFHTALPIMLAFKTYDNKYSISRRRHIAPTFNEIRHILNLAQIMAIGENLRMISFDGDQTLYDDGGNFDARNDELALAIIRLLCHGVKVAIITAAGYGPFAEKYEHRLQGLLERFVEENMTREQVENFFVFGGECNYLFRCTAVSIDPIIASLESSTSLQSMEPALQAKLLPVPVSVWQAESLDGPRPAFWPAGEITTLLDIAERTMKETVEDLRLRARILRKERSVGTFPGGSEMIKICPVGHGSNRLKREALDELVLRTLEAIRVHEPPLTIPFCVFNGGTDAWVDVGNKSVAVSALQAFFNLRREECLHVGDQFSNVGNDIAARKTCPCIWIINPRETGKVLQHVLKYRKIAPISQDEGMAQRMMKEGDAAKLNVYTGEMN